MRYVLYVFLCDLKNPANKSAPRAAISWGRKTRNAWVTFPTWFCQRLGGEIERRGLHLLWLV